MQDPMTARGAVIGMPKVGKSAFINSLCKLYNSPNRAKESISAASANAAKAQTYKAEELDLEITELPAVSSMNFGKDRYSRKFNLKGFDFFIIMIVSPRLDCGNQMNKWLIEHIELELKKPYFIVKSMMDMTVTKHALEMGITKPFEKLDKNEQREVEESAFRQIRMEFSTIRRDFKQPLHLIGRTGGDLMHTYDFALLVSEIKCKLPDYKQLGQLRPMHDWNLKDILKIFSPSKVGETMEEFVLKLQTMECKQTIVHGAITGVSGSGKSSFINSFFGSRMAAEGTKQTTMIPTTYESPDKKLKLTDLPGVGTKEFPQATYEDKMNLKQYDFFVLMVTSDVERTGETEKMDAWLIQIITQKLKKPVFVAKTAFDDLVNQHAMEIYNKPLRELDVAKKKRVKDLAAKVSRLRHFGLSKRIYLLGRDPDSAEYPKHAYEFTELYEDIYKSLPTIKKATLVANTNLYSIEWIKQKQDLLSKYIIKYSAISACFGLCPIPGVSVAVDAVLALRFARLCRTIFGLDEAALEAILSPGLAARFARHIDEISTVATSVVTLVGSVTDVVKLIPCAGTLAGIFTGASVSGPVMFFSLYHIRRAYSNVLRDVIQALHTPLSSAPPSSPPSPQLTSITLTAPRTPHMSPRSPRTRPTRAESFTAMESPLLLSTLPNYVRGSYLIDGSVEISLETSPHIRLRKFSFLS